MKKWLVLGGVGLAVIWGPYVYTELVRSPERAHGRHRHALGMFGSDTDDGSGAGAGAEGPAAAAAEPKPEPEPATTAAAQDTEKDRAKADPKAEAPDKPARPGEPESADPDDEARPVWPHELTPAFRKTFDAETRDGFWADDHEPKLRAFFAAAGVSDRAVSEVACRKTVCRIVFGLDALGDEVETKLFKASQQELGNDFAVDPKYNDAHAALYELRKGYQLER